MILAERSFLTEELARRQNARKAEHLARDFDEADALITPLVVAIAKLAAVRDASHHFTNWIDAGQCSTCHMSGSGDE